MARTTAPQILPFKGEEPQPAPEWEQMLMVAQSRAEVEAALARRDATVASGWEDQERDEQGRWAGGGGGGEPGEAVASAVDDLRATLADGIERAATVYPDGDVVRAEGTGHDVLPPTRPGSGYTDATVIHTHPFETANEPSSRDVLWAVRWPVAESIVVTPAGDWRMAYDQATPTWQKDRDLAAIEEVMVDAERAGQADDERAASVGDALGSLEDLTGGRFTISGPGMPSSGG